MKRKICITICLFVNAIVFAQGPFDGTIVDKGKLIFIAKNRAIEKGVEAHGYPFIREEEVFNESYIKDGLYIQYYDTFYKMIRRRGYYSHGKKMGVWQEFYENGNLKLEGICKTITYFSDFASGKNLIMRVDTETPLDTIYLTGSLKLFDSIKTFVLYRDTIMNIGTKPRDFIMMFPNKQAYKVGEWRYYNESGNLIRKEYYKEGVLIKTLNS